MKHLVLSSSIVTFLMCAPAVAQPARAAGAPLELELTIATSTATRVHHVTVIEGDCVEVIERGLDVHDIVEVCTRADQAGVHVRARWEVREGKSEYKSVWTSVIARKGARLEGGRPGKVRFSLATR